MQLAGITPREVVGVVREAREAAGGRTGISVIGVLAAELARELGGRDAAPGDVRVGGDPTAAAALVVVLAGTPGADEERAMRAAARALVPIVAVQTDPRSDARLPYVLPGALVRCPPGRGFPTAEIALVLAEQLGHDAVAVAARVPALRAAVSAGLVRTASLRAAALGALPWRRGADFPVLTLVQARLVLDVAAAHGEEIGQERAPELAAVAGTGLGLRSLVRRLPVRLPLVGAATGYLATRALGEGAARRFGGKRAGSVRSGT
jgi:uncharacterized protein (DUF697 family)